MSERLCRVCNAPLVQRGNETSYRFRQRTCCSTKCTTTLANWTRWGAEDPVLHCRMCGVQLARAEGESRSTFRQRVYCSRQCRSAGISSRITKVWGARKRQRPAIPVEPARPTTRCGTVEEFLASGGKITVCPTRYAAPTQSALDDEAARERLVAIEVKPCAPKEWNART